MPPVTNCMTIDHVLIFRKEEGKFQFQFSILLNYNMLQLYCFKGVVTLISHKRQVPIKTNFSQEKVFLAAAVQRNWGLWALFTDCRRPRATLCLDMKLDQKKFEHFLVLFVLSFMDTLPRTSLLDV